MLKYLGYAFAFTGWLFAALVFRYGLYPPQLLFWLILIATSFVASGLSQDRWAGIKLTLSIWLLMPFIYKVYPGHETSLGSVLLALLGSICVAYFIGFLAIKFKLKSIIKGFTVLTLIFSIFIGGLYYQIEKAGEPILINNADAAIILGAAVWEGGRPSPSMFARVKEGVKLYERGLVDKIIVSGGLGRIPPTEAEVMGKLANELGIPIKDVILEKEARSTKENIMFSKALGENLGFENYIIVTDAFHLKRALLIAGSMELNAQGVPALESPLYTNRWLRIKYTLRETFGLIQYYLKLQLEKCYYLVKN